MQNRKPEIKKDVDLRAIFRQSYSGRFVSSVEIDKPTTVKIAGFDQETIKSWQKGSEPKDRAILYFEGKDRGMVLNNTNFRKLVDLFGWDSADWIGKEIVLATVKKEAFGRVVDSIEVRAAGKVEKGISEDINEDEIPELQR